MRRGFKKWCEDQAAKWRQELGLPLTGRLPADLLAKRLNIKLLYPRNIPGVSAEDLNQLTYTDPCSWSAVTVAVERCRFTILNSNHSSARRESNLMHELAHIICEHQSKRVVIVPGVPFPLREYRKEDEKEAEWLGGCLQIPRVGLVWALGQNMTQNQIATYYGASSDMVRFRRNVTGVDRQFQRWDQSRS